MRSLYFLAIIFISVCSVAEVTFKKVNNGDLRSSEVQHVQALINQLGIEEYHAQSGSVEVEYSCTTTPMMKVYCSVSLNSEFGRLGAAVLSLDRNENQARLIEHLRD